MTWALARFFDETDGKTAETALTITQPDIRLKKNNGNWAQKAAAQTLTHEENGWYELTLDTTDTDTIGILLVAIHESGALPVWVEFHVLAANVYDSLFGAATDKLQCDTVEVSGTTQTAGDIYAKVTNLPSDPADQSALEALLNAIDDFVDTEVAAIKAKTDLIPGTQDGLTFANVCALIASVLLGKASGLGTATATYRDPADVANRVVATVDADGNRTAVTLTPP